MQDAVAREPSRQQTPICGRYELLEPIGSGGSGQVWLARDELASREVALKIVHGAGRAAERAEREAAAVARLDDPRCAELYSIERDERNVYLVYEYIEGKTLREALGEYSLTDADVVEVSAQILEALDHAHAHGIVHRDIKPTNVLLEESDAGEIRVRVLDFGLALIDDVDSLTAAGDVPGTLAYISPERLAGEQACGGADVWSVGLILWEGLGGRHPFFSNSPVETAELIAAGAPSLAAERPDLGARLVAAIEQALSVDPEDRPAPLVLAQRLRSALVPGARRRTRRARVSRGLVAERGVHAGLAAAFVATALSLFPFFPPSFTVPLATGLALLAFAAPRLGLAATLAVPVLPLGDVSGGLAVAYGAFAIGWFIVMRRSPTSALLPVGGPILAAFGALAAAPLLALRTPGVARRALVGGIAVLAAIAMEGLRTHILPPTGEAAPLGLGIEGSVSPTAVVSALAAFLADRPALVLTAAIVAIAAVLIPVVVRRSVWTLALGGTAFLVSLALGPTLALGADVALAPLVVTTWAAVLALAVPIVLRIREGTPPAEPGRERSDTNPVVGDDASLGDVWQHVVGGDSGTGRPAST